MKALPLLLLPLCLSCAVAVEPGAESNEPDAAKTPDAKVSSPDGSVAHDASSVDASTNSNLDASVPDASLVADASLVDAGIKDAAPDVAVVDSGSVCATKTTGVLATFDLTNEPGNQASTAATSTAAGLAASPLKRAAPLTAVTGSGSINASNWATGSSVDPTRYYTVTLTPDPKCALSLTSLAIDPKVSGTGPANGALATSRDAFGTTTTFTTASASTVAVVVPKASGALEVRIYGYNAGSTGGTFRIQNTLTISGAIE